MKMTTELANAYLSERAEYVVNNTLDQDRLALQKLPNVANKLPAIRSMLGDGILSQRTRAYTPQQLALIRTYQPPRHALATELAETCNLRAHEFLTLRPANEQPKSSHRVWSDKRFIGRNGMLYTVIGKGGLIREVLVPYDLAEKLELVRYTIPIKVRDRKINYHSYYKIGGGQAWSQNFTKNSQRMIGWSTGAHSTRHTYAQTRMDELQSMGFLYTAALEIVSQEMGHFRASITEIYLR